MDRILADYRSLIEPNLTHWNHPGFLAYFANTGSLPGIVGETLAATVNNNAMLWRTGPASVELEERVCDWLRQLVGLPDGFAGHINDTASTGSLLALAVARHRAAPDARWRGLIGRGDLPALRVYCSDQAHSSIDKAALVLGIGTGNVVRISSDESFRLRPEALASAIAEDRAAGRMPLAAVATLGTTSSTSVDPVGAMADICRREGIWLHVDAAYAGSAAVCPEQRAKFAGWERADSIVVNPHKWLFTPMDCSVLWLHDAESLRSAFSLTPEYLRTPDSGTNLMDLGFQLGRRFRSLKLWMVLRAYGARGLRERIRRHCDLARELEGWIRATPGFEVVAPVPFSVVCFRATPDAPPDQQDQFNERLLAKVNAAGPFFLSHTRLRGRLVLRIAIGNEQTRREHVAAAWQLVRSLAKP